MVEMLPGRESVCNVAAFFSILACGQSLIDRSFLKPLATVDKPVLGKMHRTRALHRVKGLALPTTWWPSVLIFKLLFNCREKGKLTL